jgi:hypothetical protein
VDRCGAVATMAERKKRAVGRPKVAAPMRSIVSLKGSDELEKWLDLLTEHSESGTRTNTLRRALKAFAAQEAFDKPIPKR